MSMILISSPCGDMEIVFVDEDRPHLIGDKASSFVSIYHKRTGHVLFARDHKERVLRSGTHNAIDLSCFGPQWIGCAAMLLD